MNKIELLDCTLRPGVYSTIENLENRKFKVLLSCFSMQALILLSVDDLRMVDSRLQLRIS